MKCTFHREYFLIIYYIASRLPSKQIKQKKPIDFFGFITKLMFLKVFAPLTALLGLSDIRSMAGSRTCTKHL